MNRPLISFALTCYKHEAYIREAVESALAQDYTPLEIVVSDDCSPDRTFDIAREIAESYRGPHNLRLNRNPHNQGLAGNANQTLSMCRGELIVLAAGDDISLPQRTSVIAEAWNDSERKSTILCSRFTVIDGSGCPVENAGNGFASLGKATWRHEQGSIRGFLRRRKPHVAGCAYAISPRLMSVFGPLPEAVTYEDTEMCFRTVLSKGVFTFIDQSLLKYRRHGANITFGLHVSRPQTTAAFRDFQNKRRCELDRFIATYEGFAADAERAWSGGLLSKEEYSCVKRWISAEGRRFQLKRQLLDVSWLRRLAIFGALFSTTLRPRETLEHLPYLLPGELHCAGTIMRNRMLRLPHSAA